MAQKVGSLIINLALESGAFRSGLSQTEKQLNASAKRIQAIGKSMQDFGQKMALAVTVPLGAFAGISIKVASDAAELQSAFNQTFGSMAASMTAWAQTTGDAMGRSTQEMERAANTFGLFFNQAAPTKEAAADMSRTFAVLAQDLSSFYNVDPGTAMEKLRSGLSGESEPLRDFGVFLTEAAVNAKALEMGLGGATGKVSEQAKIMARYQLILEATTNAQGDVARTSDGLANRSRATQAAIEELQVSIGDKLKPIMLKLLDITDKVLTAFTSLPDGVQNAILVLGGVAAAAGPVSMALGGIVKFTSPVAALFKGMMVGKDIVGIFKNLVPITLSLGRSLMTLALNPVGLTIIGIAAAVYGVYQAWKHWDEIKAIMKRLYDGVKTWVVDKLGAVWDWVVGKIKWVQDAFFKLYDAVVGHSYIPDMVDGIALHMSRLNAVMVDPALSATERTKQAFEQLSTDIQGIMESLFPEAKNLSDFRDQLATLDAGIKAGGAGGYSVAQLQAGRSRLLQGADRNFLSGVALPLSDQLALMQEPLAPMEEINAALEKLTTAANDNASEIGVANVRIAKSFKDMANDTLAVLNNLASSIKGGGFLDILSSVINLGLQLGSIGLFGSKVQANINKTPAYANGTGFHPGGLAIVGERGPELVNLPRGASVTPNSQLRAGSGGNTYNFQGNMMTPEFWAAIQQGDQAAARAGAEGGVRRMAFMNSRRVA